VNSFTFSSNPHRSYTIWLLALVLLPATALFTFGIYLQPLYGDLTRIGYYSEREFGWSKPQLLFPDTKLNFPSGPDDSGSYGSYYDILVLGDSFSDARPKFQWQNYVASSTGWSIDTLNINLIRIKQVISSQEFREHPPKILIFESVERELPGHLFENASGCRSSDYSTRRFNEFDASKAFVTSTNTTKQLPGLSSTVGRETRMNDIKLEFVWKYILHYVLKNINMDETADVYKLSLLKPAPFSSKNINEILVYKNDIEKQNVWNKAGLSAMSYCAQEIRQQVEANGYTKFVLMVAPDKLTAYSEFLQNQKLRNISLLDKLSKLQSGVMPRVDIALRKAISEGQWDVYFPDDTHWGAAGQHIVSEALVRYLINNSRYDDH
jgi:hypothetical protein